MRTFLLALAVCGGVGCGLPDSPSAKLAGSWRTSPVPSGGAITMTLSATGPNVSGSGMSQGIGPNPIVVPCTISGYYTFNAFLLTLTFDDGRQVTYSGSFISDDELTGTWTETGQSSTTVGFTRQ